MGRNPIRQVKQPSQRRALSGVVLAGIGIVLLLALVGVVSAGSFVADKLSAAKTPTTHRQTQPAGTPIAVQDIARAEAQATAIVKSAQTTGNAMVTSVTKQARRQAAAIVARARQQAARVTASASASAFATATAVTTSSSAAVAAPGSAATGSGSGAVAATGGSASSPSTSGAFSGTTTGGSAASASGSSSQASGTSSQATGAGTSGQATGQTAGGSGSSSTTPDLSGVPASWRVVGYNATFGSGPGSAGSITVVNRGVKTYSGVATVEYNAGGSASASFSGLAPGETEVLPLDGPAYPGGGYTIAVNVG